MNKHINYIQYMYIYIYTYVYIMFIYIMTILYIIYRYIEIQWIFIHILVCSILIFRYPVFSGNCHMLPMLPHNGATFWDWAWQEPRPRSRKPSRRPWRPGVHVSCWSCCEASALIQQDPAMQSWRKDCDGLCNYDLYTSLHMFAHLLCWLMLIHGNFNGKVRCTLAPSSASGFHSQANTCWASGQSQACSLSQRHGNRCRCTHHRPLN